MAAPTRWSVLRIGVIVGAAAVVLGVLSTFGLAVLSGAFGGRGEPWVPGARPLAPAAAACGVPSLPGSEVVVTVADMGAMMDRYQGRGPEAGPGRWPGMGPGMGRMNMAVAPARGTAGQVSIRVDNIGWRVHEMVVLPLAAGQTIGARTVGPDGKIDEVGNLGEASRSCGAGGGDGIDPGAIGWVSLTLPPGRYELVCNLAGHYAAGMYAELDVTG